MADELDDELDDGLDDDLGRTLFAVVRRYRRLTDDLLAGLPGGPRGYQVLVAVAHQGPRSQLALAQYLGLDRTVMTYLLDDLVRADLVVREPDPADRRVRRVGLTTTGRRALDDARARLVEAEDAFLAPLDPVAREGIRSSLLRLASAGQD